MFALVTISNGVAVVQHAPTGWIYRFRPTHPGVWSRLALHAVDGGDRDGHAACEHAGAARAFAETAAAACCDAADTPAAPERPSRLRALLFAGALRPLGQV